MTTPACQVTAPACQVTPSWTFENNTWWLPVLAKGRVRWAVGVEEAPNRCLVVVRTGMAGRAQAEHSASVLSKRRDATLVARARRIALARWRCKQTFKTFQVVPENVNFGGVTNGGSHCSYR